MYPPACGFVLATQAEQGALQLSFSIAVRGDEGREGRGVELHLRVDVAKRRMEGELIADEICPAERNRVAGIAVPFATHAGDIRAVGVEAIESEHPVTARSAVPCAYRAFEGAMLPSRKTHAALRAIASCAWRRQCDGAGDCVAAPECTHGARQYLDSLYGRAAQVGEVVLGTIGRIVQFKAVEQDERVVRFTAAHAYLGEAAEAAAAADVHRGHRAQQVCHERLLGRCKFSGSEARRAARECGGCEWSARTENDDLVFHRCLVF